MCFFVARNKTKHERSEIFGFVRAYSEMIRSSEAAALRSSEIIERDEEHLCPNGQNQA